MASVIALQSALVHLARCPPTVYSWLHLDILTTGHDEALSEVQGGTLKIKEGPGWNVEGSQEPQ